MNLLIFEPDEVNNDHIVQIYGRRHQHLRNILKVIPGDTLRAGVLNCGRGVAEVMTATEEYVQLRYVVDTAQTNPQPLPCTLILALPRPQVVKRVLTTAAEIGIKDIHLIHAAKVEKSFWQSPELLPENIKQRLLLGLEQSMDTALPQVHLHKGFKSFSQKVYPNLCDNRISLVADPGADEACPRNIHYPVNLIIGPEGGWNDYEIEALTDGGGKLVRLGSRIFRVEHALVFTLGRLFDF